VIDFLVLGIGNRMMTDDGIGIAVVEQLMQKDPFPGMRYAAGETDVDFCIDELINADKVIIIDAAKFGEEPCSVSFFSLEEIMEQIPEVRSVHDIDLLQTMKRDSIKKNGLLIAVEVGNIDSGIGLSPEIEEKFGDICEKVEKIINLFIKGE